MSSAPAQTAPQLRAGGVPVPFCRQPGKQAILAARQAPRTSKPTVQHKCPSQEQRHSAIIAASQVGKGNLCNATEGTVWQARPLQDVRQQASATARENCVSQRKHCRGPGDVMRALCGHSTVRCVCRACRTRGIVAGTCYIAAAVCDSSSEGDLSPAVCLRLDASDLAATGGQPMIIHLDHTPHLSSRSPALHSVPPPQRPWASKNLALSGGMSLGTLRCACSQHHSRCNAMSACVTCGTNAKTARLCAVTALHLQAPCFMVCV